MYIINKLPFHFCSWLNKVYVLDYLYTPSPSLPPENGEYAFLQKKLQFKTKALRFRKLTKHFYKNNVIRRAIHE